MKEKKGKMGRRRQPEDIFGPDLDEPSLDTDDVDALVSQGIDFYFMDEKDKALKCFNRAIEVDPNFAEAWRFKGIVLSWLQDQPGALKCLERATELKPVSVDAWTNLAALHRTMHSYEEAHRCIDRCLELESDFPPAIDEKINILIDQGELEKALQVIGDFEENFPELTGFEARRGEILSSLVRTDQALSCFERALELDPDDAFALYSKGAILFKEGQYEEALSCFEEVLRIGYEYDYLEAYLFQGFALIALERYDQALRGSDPPLHPHNIELLSLLLPDSNEAPALHKSVLPVKCQASRI
jgi:tetratricopeptide (TPR) repeat protein